MYWTARSASLLQQAAARPRGVWGCAPDNKGGCLSGRRSAHLHENGTVRSRKAQSASSEARGVWGCAPVDRGGRLAADSPQEKLAFASFSCGDGRSRTAVRIKRQGAFYMLILPLVVGGRLPVGGPSAS